MLNEKTVFSTNNGQLDSKNKKNTDLSYDNKQDPYVNSAMLNNSNEIINNVGFNKINKSKKHLFIPIGIPGSGKTYQRELIKNELKDIIVVSPDEVRFSMLNSSETKIYYDEKIEPVIWKKVYEQFNDAIKQNKSIYLDATNLYVESREYFVKIARENGYNIHFIFLKIPLEVALERNKNRERKVDEEVIKKMYYTMDVPSSDEYDSITIINNF